MKTILSIGIFLMMFITSFTTQAQSTNFVGKWESITPVSFYNNNILKIKIIGTDNPNCLIIVNAINPKKKFVAKYDDITGRLYVSYQTQQLYLEYYPDTDMLRVFKTDGTFICYMTRFL